VKTKGKLNAVAPATSGVSADVSAIVTSESTSTELETELECQLHGLLDSSIKHHNIPKTPSLTGVFILYSI
jgi:hypothetical protein